VKRWRITSISFDSRPLFLDIPPLVMKTTASKVITYNNSQKAKAGFTYEYGEKAIDQKLKNLKDLSATPFSIVSYHNRFYFQIRDSFVIGAYYPALVAACSLGERILNNLMLRLRENFIDKPEYKKVYKNKSFDDCGLLIDTLSSWGILVPEATNDFKKLSILRHKSIHFNPETDKTPRGLALQAIKNLNQIIDHQFSAKTPSHWLFYVSGEYYFKRELESNPFFWEFYMPSCQHVGYKHIVTTVNPQWAIQDENDYDDREITDAEFAQLRENWKLEQSKRLQGAD
jgi:hypothetical protein